MFKPIIFCVTIVFIVLSFVTSAWAWIPPARFILSREVQNAVDGAFQLDQEVTLRGADRDLRFIESWIVQNESSFRLNVTGVAETQNVKFSVIYIGGERFISANLNEKTQMPQALNEKYFFARKLDTLAHYLLEEKILPPGGVAKKVMPKKVEDITWPTEFFVKLARIGGGTAWAIGSQAPVGSQNQAPLIWIEQDQFLIRKMRFLGGGELRAERYENYSKRFLLPSSRTLNWGKNEAKIQILKVSLKPAAAQAPQLLKPVSLPVNRPRIALSNPLEAQLVEEFYQRYR